MNGVKLVVTKANLHHANHATDKQTYDHYPENLRIKKDKLKDVERMVSLGVNKHKLKADLMKDGDIVPLKTLHNIQTRLQMGLQQNYSGNQLAKMLERMREVPNARTRVIVNSDNELIGKIAM